MIWRLKTSIFFLIILGVFTASVDRSLDFWIDVRAADILGKEQEEKAARLDKKIRAYNIKRLVTEVRTQQLDHLGFPMIAEAYILEAEGEMPEG